MQERQHSPLMSRRSGFFFSFPVVHCLQNNWICGYSEHYGATGTISGVEEREEKTQSSPAGGSVERRDRELRPAVRLSLERQHSHLGPTADTESDREGCVWLSEKSNYLLCCCTPAKLYLFFSFFLTTNLLLLLPLTAASLFHPFFFLTVFLMSHFEEKKTDTGDKEEQKCTKKLLLSFHLSSHEALYTIFYSQQQQEADERLRLNNLARFCPS